jgi:hypothetical protein
MVTTFVVEGIRDRLLNMRNLLKTLSLGLIVFAGSAVHATTYNALTGFSTSHNPNGPWSYASGTPGAATVFGYSGTNFGPGYGFSYWSASQNNLPAVGINGTPFGTVNVPTSEVFLHPGPDAGQDAMILFTVPKTGTYDLSDFFTHRDIANAGDGQFVGTYLNGVALDTWLLGTGYGSTHSFSDILNLTAGDVLTFDVNKNGAYYYDSTGFGATITATPEPSSLLLFGTGILGAAGVIRRRFKA